MSPPPAVLAGFDVAGEATPLPGGDETSLLVGGVVLKKVIDPPLAAWAQERLSEIRCDAIRVPDPIRATTGAWTVDGWSATTFVPGLRSGLGRWSDIADAGRSFSSALAALGETDLAPVRGRTDRWAVADRFVWDAMPLEFGAEATRIVERLRANQGPEAPSQIVHADLTGNVFFDPDDIPTVIDFAPLFRPVSHSLAIVAADAMLWHDAGIDVLEMIDPKRQSIARALLFRLGSEQLAVDPRHGARVSDYHRVLDSLGW